MNMAVSVKKIVLWRAEISNEPGALDCVLAPLAEAGADLQVVMGYRYAGDETRSAVEVYPVSGRKMMAAAREAGLSASSIPTLLVEGDNRPGLGHALAEAIAEARINIAFLVTQVFGNKYSTLIGFDDEAGSRKAATLIKKVLGRRGK
jgi:hypothetical protein